MWVEVRIIRPWPIPRADSHFPLLRLRTWVGLGNRARGVVVLFFGLIHANTLLALADLLD